MNDLLIEITPYDGYKHANVMQGDVVLYQTNPGNKIAIAAKPKGLATMTLCTSNVTMNLDSVSTCPLLVTKGGQDTLLEVDGDGSVWCKNNLELGGQTVSFVDGCISCQNDALVFEAGSDPRPIRMGADGSLDARVFTENGTPLRSIYATVLDKAQLKNEITRCVKRVDLEPYATRDECDVRYMPRSKDADIVGVAKSVKRLGVSLERAAAEIRENHEWSMSAVKKCLTVSTAADMFIAAARNVDLDQCASRVDWSSNEIGKMLPRDAATDMFLTKDYETSVLTALSAGTWGSNIVQHMLPIGRAEEMFVRIQREADIDDAIDTGMWCSNYISKCLLKKEASKAFVHAPRERDIEAAYHKAQWASNNMSSLLTKADAQNMFLPYGYTSNLDAAVAWASNSIGVLAEDRAIDQIDKKIASIQSRIDWGSNNMNAFISKADAKSQFLSKSRELELQHSMSLAQWCSNQTPRFVTWQDAQEYGSAKAIEKVRGDVEAVHRGLMDLHDIVHWSSNALASVAASALTPASTSAAASTAISLDFDVESLIDRRIEARMGQTPPDHEPRTETRSPAPSSRFSCIHRFCDSSNNDVFELRDALYNPPFITLPPTLGAASKHGFGLWSSHKRGCIAFHIGDQTGYPIEYMRLTSKGYLGIGTPSPQHELEVVGTANIESIKEDGIYLHKKYATKTELDGFIKKDDLETISGELLRKTGEIVKGSRHGEHAQQQSTGYFSMTDGLMRVPSALERVQKLTGYTNTRQAALSEAEVKKHLPEATSWAGGPDVMALMAYLVEAVKDLSARVDAFERLR